MNTATGDISRYCTEFWQETCPEENRDPMEAGFRAGMTGMHSRNLASVWVEMSNSLKMGLMKTSVLDLSEPEVLGICPETGLVSIPLAEIAGNGRSLDRSVEILKQRIDRAEKKGVPITRSLLEYWDDLDSYDVRVRGVYDLVITSMTTGVRCPGSFKLMLELSKGVGSYSVWLNHRCYPVYHELHHLLFSDEFREAMHGFYLPFMYLYLLGHHPIVHISQDVWRNDETIDEIVNLVSGFFGMSRVTDADMKRRIRDYFLSRVKEGMNHGETVTTTGMMVWDRRDRRTGS
jgi:hypothetical protein